jgi:cytidylate kinase
VGVVTVSRLYGAGGMRVAPMVAAKLGYRLVDREIVELAAREAGVDPDTARRLDERAPALIEKVGLALASASPEFGLGYPPPLHDRALAEGIRRVFRSLAESGGYVILGRGGQAALRDRTDAVHIQLVADLEDRARRVADWQGIPLDEARERCRQVDGERTAYVRRFYDIDIRDATLYHAVLNTSRLGLDRAAQFVVRIARETEA